MLRSPDALGKLPPEGCLNPGYSATLSPLTEKARATDEAQRQLAREAMPAAQQMVLLQDFEFWAQKVLSGMAWGYYRSAADHEKCKKRNADRPNLFYGQ